MNPARRWDTCSNTDLTESESCSSNGNLDSQLGVTAAVDVLDDSSVSLDSGETCDEPAIILKVHFLTPALKRPDRCVADEKTAPVSVSGIR